MRIAVVAVAGVMFSSVAVAAEPVAEAGRKFHQSGLAALREGRPEEAVKELRRAFAIDHRPSLLLDLARAYEKLNDPRNLADTLQRYLDLAPDAPDAQEVRRLLGAANARLQATSAASVTAVVDTVVPQLPAAVRDVAPADPCADRRVPRAVTGEAIAAQLEWAHDPIDAAPRGQPVAVSVQAPVSREVKLNLHYRVAGESDFTAVEMRRHGPDKLAQIPADAMRGTSVQYFIEARHAVSGALLYASGSRVDPNIIYLEGLEGEGETAGE